MLLIKCKQLSPNLIAMLFFLHFTESFLSRIFSVGMKRVMAERQRTSSYAYS